MSDAKQDMLDINSLCYRGFSVYIQLTKCHMLVEISHYFDIWDIRLEAFQWEVKSMADKYPGFSMCVQTERER